MSDQLRRHIELLWQQQHDTRRRLVGFDVRLAELESRLAVVELAILDRSALTEERIHQLRDMQATIAARLVVCGRVLGGNI